MCAAVAAGTDIGKKVKASMESGALMADEIVVESLRTPSRVRNAVVAFFLTTFHERSFRPKR